MSTLGTLEILRRYPVKSMRGEDLTAAHIGFNGVAGDRIYAFINAGKAGNFPWHSAREQHDLLLYKPHFAVPPPPEVQYPREDAFTVSVTTPAGRTLDVRSADLLAEVQAKAGYDVTLRFSEKGMQDARPLSIFGLETARALGVEAGREVDHRRFRANFYVRWADPTPFFEDSLVGKRLQIGDRVEVMVVKKDPRCIMINVDPDTAEADPVVLRTVAKGHRGCAGVYAAVLREGIVHPGDSITLLD